MPRQLRIPDRSEEHEISHVLEESPHEEGNLDPTPNVLSELEPLEVVYYYSQAGQ